MKNSKKSDPNAAHRTTQKRAAIGRHLQDAYRSVVEEPLPDTLASLLDQLDALGDPAPDSIEIRPAEQPAAEKRDKGGK